ncbi:MAG TPA: hypothetical protein VFC75_03885 [Erysipelothrix sp.]|nr:hypothetical protein [Erysipelothrix sp.]
MKRYSILLIVLLFLVSGCKANNDALKRIEELEKENKMLETLLADRPIEQVYTYKDEMELEVIILDKLQLDDETKNYLLVTQLDVDHNTPLVIAVHQESAFKKFEVGEETTIKVYVITVVEDDHQRFEFFLVD